MQQLRSFTPSATWGNLPDVPGKSVDLINNSGALLELRWGHDTATDHQISLADGQSVRLNPAFTASELEAQGAGTGAVSLICE